MLCIGLQLQHFTYSISVLHVFNGNSIPYSSHMSIYSMHLLMVAMYAGHQSWSHTVEWGGTVSGLDWPTHTRGQEWNKLSAKFLGCDATLPAHSVDCEETCISGQPKWRCFRLWDIQVRLMAIRKFMYNVYIYLYCVSLIKRPGIYLLPEFADLG